MAGIPRWYKKWEALEVDSDGEDAKAAPDLDTETREVLARFPQGLATSLSQQPNKAKREALMVLNCYIGELSKPPQTTPAAQQKLLAMLCEALRGLEEGGEAETLLFQVLDRLSDDRVDPQHVEHAIGAVALLPAHARDSRVVEVVVQAGLRRLGGFSAHCLARACWAAATLGESAAASELLRAAMPAAAKRALDFEPDDVSLFAWACAVARPPGAREALETLLARAGLPEPETHDGRVTAWAVECWGLDATPLFGVPSAIVPADLARGVHARILALRDGAETQVLHAADPPVVRSTGFLTAEEAAALLDIAQTRWSRSAVGSGENSDWRTSDTAMLDLATGPRAPVVDRVCRRAAKLAGLPESHCEAPQVVRYLHNERYEEHADYITEDQASRSLLYLGGQRVATVLVYLSTVPAEAGGETRFPRLGISTLPVLGHALIWPNIDTCGKVDGSTVHASAPILDPGCAKYCLNLWLRAYSVRDESARRSMGAVGGTTMSSGAATGASGTAVASAACARAGSTEPLSFEPVD